ncbi:YidC/Oxa1 family membrane protein insertase [Patescibacteria group bacterium]|nr:YidC/Oxa1 family membrane protein insertase [Patescibacteria group bacterium]
MWNTILINPIFNLLIGLYRLTGNLGVSIIFFTIVAKTILIPVTIPQIKMAKKQRDIQPELDKIKQKFKYDKKKQAELQMELFKKHGINPGAGCFTTIITFVLMIAIYRAITTLTMATDIIALNDRIYFEGLKFFSGENLATKFLYLDMTKPDPLLIVTVLTVVSQFLATKMISPYSKTATKAVKKTPGQADDIMQAMQKQNQYVMPIMFFVFGITLPSGVMLYILTSTIFQIGQTYFFSGWGGLKPWINKLKSGKKER